MQFICTIVLDFILVCARVCVCVRAPFVALEVIET